MEIIIADNAGFCGGVSRAVKLATDALKENDQVYSMGPLVHNRNLVERLQSEGLDDYEENTPSEPAVVVTRSHGLCVETKAALMEAGHTIVDATCPVLTKMYKTLEEMKEKGYTVVIIGDRTHPEVVALSSQVDYKAIIVDTLEEAQAVNGLTDVYVLSQTTNREDKFQQLSTLIASNNQNVVIQDTICNATRLRQEACAKIAREVDAMIVIGGSHSSNTQKLAQVASQFCKRVYPIESAVELPIDELVQLKKIGITAGASTPDWLIEEVVERMDNYSKDDFMEQLEDTMKQIHPKEIISGEVLYVTDTEVQVSIGYKSDGIIKLDELSEDPSLKPRDLFTEGQTIEVYVIKLDDGDGNVILSSRRVEKYKNWQKLMEMYEAGETVEAVVEKDVKGGLIVNVMGINGFIPGSHIDTHFVRDLKSFIGKTVPTKIISIDEKKRRLVLSRKVIVEAEKKAALDKAWENIHAGEVVTGKVARLTDFGAFIDLGGIDGLLHVSDISWKRLKHPSDALNVGDEIEVKIIRANRETNRISLGRKQLMDKPFDEFVKNNEVGDIVTGTVVNLLDFGAFVRLKEGVEGLVHVSQISHERVEKPSDELNSGDEVEVKIVEINTEAQKIGLSIKETKPQERKEKAPKSDRVQKFGERAQSSQQQQPRRQRRQPERRSTPVYKGEDFENTIGSLVDFDFGMLGFDDVETAPVEAEVETAETVVTPAEVTELAEDHTEEIVEAVETPVEEEVAEEVVEAEVAEEDTEEENTEA